MSGVLPDFRPRDTIIECNIIMLDVGASLLLPVPGLLLPHPPPLLLFVNFFCNIQLVSCHIQSGQAYRWICVSRSEGCVISCVMMSGSQDDPNRRDSRNRADMRCNVEFFFLLVNLAQIKKLLAEIPFEIAKCLFLPIR